MVAKIESLQHSKVKLWAHLRVDRQLRQERQEVLIAGEKMIRELASHSKIKILLTTQPATNLPAQEHYLVTEAILQKITGLPSTDGFAAIATMPPPQDIRHCKRLLILDRLSDPGNLGTLLRTALALNWDGVVMTPGTVDPFNDKALRASKGAIFFLPFAFATTSEIQSFQQTPYLADIDGAPLSQVKFKLPLALILSNEAQGPASWAEKWAEKISIPMHNQVESLNVAASGAILLYELGAR